MHRIWGLLFGGVLLGAFALTAFSPAVHGWWLPKPASSYAPDIDFLFYLILGTVTFFYVLTEAILVLNIFRSGAPGAKAQYTHGSHKLELVWSIVPGAILIGLAVIQVNTWAGIKYPSRLSQTIRDGKEKYMQLGIEARQWEFRMRYPSPAHMDEWQDSKVAAADFDKRMPERVDDVWLPNDVHVWKGQKVVMFLKTRDVGHAIFFPNLRLKQDALPGRTIPVWFDPTVSNTKKVNDTTWVDGYTQDGKEDTDQIFDLVCTQYCGSRHSLMRGKLYVHPDEADFRAWLNAARQNETTKTGPVVAAQ
jgi:cytochrome c oxidase subunit 2